MSSYPDPPRPRRTPLGRSRGHREGLPGRGDLLAEPGHACDVYSCVTVANTGYALKRVREHVPASFKSSARWRRWSRQAGSSSCGMGRSSCGRVNVDQTALLEHPVVELSESVGQRRRWLETRHAVDAGAPRVNKRSARRRRTDRPRACGERATCTRARRRRRGRCPTPNVSWRAAAAGSLPEVHVDHGEHIRLQPASLLLSRAGSLSACGTPRC